MKKQIKLTLLGTMLFTGAISIQAMDKTETPVSAPTPKVVLPAKQQTPAVTKNQTPATDTTPSVATEKVELPSTEKQPESTPAQAEVKKNDEKSEGWFSTGCTAIKNIVTNKWVLGTGAVVVGAYIAFRIYQAYNDEEAEAEQPLV